MLELGKKYAIPTFRIISFILLAWVSFNLSLDLFMQFGTGTKDSSLFVMLVVGLELSKVLSLIMAKSNLYLISQSKKYILKTVGFSILYVGLAMVSIFSAYGFVRTSIEFTTSKVTATKQDDTKLFYEGKIREFQTKIDSYLPQLARADLSLASKTAYEKLIREAETEQATYVEKLQNLKLVTVVEKKEATNMYSLIAFDMGLEERLVRFWVQIITVLIVEICLATMAPGIHPSDAKIESPVNANGIGDEMIPTPKSLSFGIQENAPLKKRKYTKRVKTEEKEPEIAPEKLVEPIVEHPEIKPVEPVIVEETKAPEPIKERTPIAPLVREPAFERFVHALFNNGTNTNLINKTDAIDKAGIPIYRGTEYFNLLSSIKGKTGYPLIEYRKDNKWYPNYSEQYIINLYKEGKILKEGASASKVEPVL